jgi:hypothetical protein
MGNASDEERAMTETRTDDVAAIKSVLEEQYKAWDAGDADAFVTDYAEDATVVMPGIYRRSKEEIRRSMAESFEARGRRPLPSGWWPRRTRSGRSSRERTSPGSSPCRTRCWTGAIPRGP